MLIEKWKEKNPSDAVREATAAAERLIRTIHMFDTTHNENFSLTKYMKKQIEIFQKGG